MISLHHAAADELPEQIFHGRRPGEQFLVEPAAGLARNAAENDHQRLVGFLRLRKRFIEVVVNPDIVVLECFAVAADFGGPILADCLETKGGEDRGKEDRRKES